MKLILIRHGQTQWNSESRVQGRTDIPLNEKGRQQARAIALRLQGIRFDAVYASPLSRAKETAETIAKFSGAEVVLDEDITEIQFGKWEGMTSEELHVTYPELFFDWGWIDRTEDCKSMEAEPQHELAARSLRFVERLKACHPDSARILVVGHTMPTKLIIAHFIGLPYERMRSLRIENCAYNELDTGHNERGFLNALNDTSHLRGLL
ncbi:MAG: histidine phosphatase family protein [Clostridiaceae bacterium]|nr:histidine phosphatase family protein [Eubacteriales bacterium]